MNLDKHIKDLLFQLDRVAVKGLGTFITYTTNALINDKEKLIEPPRKAVSFSKDMDVDPDIFTTFVSEKENISSEYVSGEIVKYVQTIKEDVLSNKGYTILGVGTFLKEKTGTDFRFIPDPRANFNQSTFGLPSVGLPKKQAPTTPPPPSIDTTPIEKKSYFSEDKEGGKLEPITNKAKETTEKKGETKKGGDWNKLFGLKKGDETSKTNIGNNYRKEEEKTVSSVLADNVHKEETIEVDPVPEFEEDVAEPKKSRMMGCLLPLLAALLLGFLVLQVTNNTSLQKMPPFSFFTGGSKKNTELADKGKTYVDEEDKLYNDNSSSTTTNTTEEEEVVEVSKNPYEEAEVEPETKNSTYTEATDYAENNTANKNTTKTKTTPPPKPTNTTKPKPTNTSKSKNNTTSKSNNVAKGGGSSTKVYGNSEVPKGYYANIGVFRSRVNALKVAKETQAKGYPVYVTNYKNDLYRIGVHLSEDSAESKRKLSNIKKNVKNDAWIYKN